MSTYPEHHESLLGFAQEIMAAWPRGNIDGGDLQEFAISYGILVEYRPTEPCGDNCDCQIAYPPEDFEQGEVVCYRLAEWMR